MFRYSSSRLLIWLIYVGLLGSLIATLTVARQRLLATPASAAEQEDWQQWRDEAARQESGSGPVSRRVPQATEPPTRVLLRNHFATSLITLSVDDLRRTEGHDVGATLPIRTGIAGGPVYDPLVVDCQGPALGWR